MTRWIVSYAIAISVVALFTVLCLYAQIVLIVAGCVLITGTMLSALAAIVWLLLDIYRMSK